MRRLALFGLALTLISGCLVEDDGGELLPDVIEYDGSGLVTFRDVADNGVVGNGFRWNGFRWNGFRWNGFRWNGFRWNGVRWNGGTVTNVRYDASTGSLAADDTTSSTVDLTPADEVVAEGDHTDGTESETKITQVEEVTGGAHDYQFQRVQTRILVSAPSNWGPWEEACVDGAGDPVKAILLKGDWSSPGYARISGVEADQATTWACRGAALAKCVEWGYHPEGLHSGTSLADHHQACTRLVRADYCGDGEHHTENGTLIDVEDSLGIQTHSTVWGIEAAWGANGALCLNDPRKTYWSRAEALDGCANVPRCDTETEQHWWDEGALFVTRNQPTALVAAEPAPADSGG
ncbi:MAG: ADYC domain-containing protein [Myxococcota bacterium]